MAAKPPLVRAAVELNSDKVGELPTNTRLYVVETRDMPDGAKRACVVLEGQQQPYGWLTAVSKDGIENIRKTPLPVHEVTASKPPLVRAGAELTSDKVGELPIGARFHVIETRDMPDGAKRACIALEGGQEPYGWLTSVSKDGAENLREVASAPAGSSGAGSSKRGAGAPAPSSSSADAALLRFPAEIVAVKPPLVRAGAALTSDKVGELPTGARIFVIENRDMPDGAKRACVVLEGQQQPYGWLTATTKDGVVNLRLLVHEVVAAKPPVVRAGAELTSDKVGELPTGARFHVIETRDMPDGAKRACVVLEGQQEPHGWLTSVSKDGVVNLRPVAAPAARRAAGGDRAVGLADGARAHDGDVAAKGTADDEPARRQRDRALADPRGRDPALGRDGEE